MILIIPILLYIMRAAEVIPVEERASKSKNVQRKYYGYFWDKIEKHLHKKLLNAGENPPATITITGTEDYCKMAPTFII